MNLSSPVNSVPWPQIQTYLTFLKAHDTQIAMLIKLKDDGFLDIAEVEIKITRALVQIHETVDKLLKQNTII